MLSRVGVFLCGCRGNVDSKVDLSALEAVAADLDGVVKVFTEELLCTPEPLARMSRAIRLDSLDAVVVAGCTPSEHSRDFDVALREGGLNPSLLQIANIREQCAWVTDDPEAATAKAADQLRGAVARVRLHKPLEPPVIKVAEAVCVIGGGPAGLGAARTLAQAGRRVELIESSPALGGMAMRQGLLFPEMECGSCLLSPLVTDVLADETTGVSVLSRVAGVIGRPGKFQITVETEAGGVDPEKCLGCLSCQLACPVEFEGGAGPRRAIGVAYPGAQPNVANIDFEQCLRANGQECSLCAEACPVGAVTYDDEVRSRVVEAGAIVFATGVEVHDPRGLARFGGGERERILLPAGMDLLLESPDPLEGVGKVALVHCAGSRCTDSMGHCSTVCCEYLTRFARQINQKWPGADLTAFYSDYCSTTPNSEEAVHDLVLDAGLDRVRVANPSSVSVSCSKETPTVTWSEPGGGGGSADFDLVLLAPPIVGSQGGRQLAGMLGLETDAAGFIPGHGSITSAQDAREGLYVAGAASGPKSLRAAFSEGVAAAGQALAFFKPGEEVELFAAVASVDPDRCGGCGVCSSLCPFGAIIPDDAGRQRVEPWLCRGCGICAGACPAGAIELAGYTAAQLKAEIGGLCG